MRSLQTFMTIQAAFSTLVHGQDEQALIQMTWPDANESFYSVINGKKVTHNGGHDDWGLSSRNFQCSDVNPPSDAKRTLLSIDGFHVQLSQMWDSKTVSSSFEIGRWMIDWSFGQFEGLDGANATAFAWSNGLYYDGLSDLGVTCGDRLLAPNSYGIPNWEEEGIVDIFQVEPGRWNGVNATLGISFQQKLPGSQTELPSQTFIQCAYVQFTTGPVPASPCQAGTPTTKTTSSESPESTRATRTGFSWDRETPPTSTSASNENAEDDGNGGGDRGLSAKDLGLAIGLSLGILALVGLIAYFWPRLPVKYTSRVPGTSGLMENQRETSLGGAPEMNGQGATLQVPATIRTASTRSSSPPRVGLPGGYYHPRQRLSSDFDVEAGSSHRQHQPLPESEMIMVQAAIADSNEPNKAIIDEPLPPYPGPPPEYER
ncbi:hypothetical protein VD0002_g4789 [Verticillium dahliae]|uniref:Uncharacterized protein n=2 Tax=Verticillium dahliae TaxID=27337 RepID=G2WUT5_VERDV|nr:uncharacterized protein VDAG_02076 [Verticillium dahliae VdLs.17]KAH6690147.1 hypothetical protein EV126DRAFT_483476 [Verticillium dahliae]EGY20060.1 hypothetical protein VDAG_02076 [Verticillium dahliae VdLs.17]PNH31011.1 hypothetical protein BJF96_g5681 [Verticillium dahliae]PNH53445.1 hypothetical protein VD0003_g3949 [Verticillium dahliae]PNH63606.1 hypothetical protein VD0002_g4789 [Verticillium dahliae]